MARRTILERIVDERAGHTVVGNVSVTIERIAEEIARETLSDETFRRSLRELVRRRSQEILDDLLRKRKPATRGSVRRRRARTR